MKLKVNNNNNNNWLFLLLILGIGSAWSQSFSKRQVKPEDYVLWSTLSDEKISEDGNWVSYRLNYQSAKDTLFVQNTQTGKKQYFPSAENGLFSPDKNWWIAQDPKNGMALLNLKSGTLQWLQGVVKYEFVAAGNYLVLLKQEAQQEPVLHIIHLKTGKEHTIPNITEYRFNAAGTILACIIPKENAVKLVRMNSDFTTETVVQEKGSRYKDLTWNSKGDALAFFQEIEEENGKAKNHKIYYVKQLERTPKLYVLDPLLETDFLKDQNIVIPFAREPLQISEDGKRIFFNVASSVMPAQENDTAQVWNTVASGVHHGQQPDPTHIPKLTAWWPEQSKLLQIATNDLPNALLTDKQNYALTFDNRAYEPQYESEAVPDFYLTDFNTGKSSLVVKKQLRSDGTMGSSPKGRYINYFKDKKWWVYDSILKKNTNVTAVIPAPVHNLEFDQPGATTPYGSPGWTQDGKLIVYDQYDIWIVTPDGKNAKRLTQGREQKIRFRIYQNLNESDIINTLSNLPTHTFNFTKGTVLEAFGDTKASGYYYLESNGDCKVMVYKNARISTLRKATQSEKYMYKEESFESSPQLKLWSKTMKKEQVVLKTNPQQEKFSWGHSELISYSNQKGQALQGVLFYPAGFQSGKKYPMIVHLYERQSGIMHHYINPTQYISDGFNPVNYTFEGYLVFYPDIAYEVGAPGQSAVTGVQAAVDSVVAKGIVESNHIGLIGGSFGGYETAFIISQTNRFATAVAGVACTDLVSSYLSMESSGDRSHMWRYESAQLRMGTSLFDNYKGYIENSPIAHASKINTPVLIWTGQQDPNVNWTQSIELHLALQRLQKPHTFLVYPGQGHAIGKPDSQIDLAKRVKEWFDHYLKEKPFTENRS
jgi:dipeptidyl aminopeptidase/acylaminoacyl peptidase